MAEHNVAWVTDKDFFASPRSFRGSDARGSTLGGGSPPQGTTETAGAAALTRCPWQVHHRFMQDAWERADELWETHFGGLGGSEGRARLVTAQEFGELFRSQMQQHFPSEAFFSMDALVPEPLQAQRSQTAKALAPDNHRFTGALEIKGELAALFSGCVYSPQAWRMWTTVVAPKFRRQGIYRQILAGHLGYSKALGFDVVRSEHAPCNNPILIAKLKAGFCVTALEIDAEHGSSLILTYFHHPQQKNAYLFRCGMATMTPELLASGNPSMQRLAQQFRGESQG